MNITREKIVERIVRNIKIICKELSDPLSRQNTNNYLIPLSITELEMKNILHKIITGLPVDFFIGYSNHVTKSIQEYIVKEYILFQVQEDITSEYFIDNLIYFIYDLKNDINNAIKHDNLLLLSD
ncbi:MAG: hypothetical protein HRT87_08820 [Legionellales bacterium]|nr:hypothetical protein [Legionellales bacterium]